MKLQSKVLDRPQKLALKQVAAFATANGFHLAGGTAVALQLGHRKSQDLDWFTPDSITDPKNLLTDLQSARIAFEFHNEGRGALHGAVNGVRVSFLEYKYPFLVSPLKAEGDFAIASLDDLSAIKLSTILQRGTRKDFVDIYALGQKHANLQQMLDCYERKFKAKDWKMVLYALSYTGDAEKEPMPKMIWKVRWPEIKSRIGEFISQWEKQNG